MKQETCVSLDMYMTGQILNHMIRKSGYKISQIQKELELACPQPIYRWMNGQVMPTIDHLYKLSRLLKVHMEDLVVPMKDDAWIVQQNQNEDELVRLKKYHMTYLERKKNRKR